MLLPIHLDASDNQVEQKVKVVGTQENCFKWQIGTYDDKSVTEFVTMAKSSKVFPGDSNCGTSPNVGRQMKFRVRDEIGKNWETKGDVYRTKKINLYVTDSSERNSMTASFMVGKIERISIETNFRQAYIDNMRLKITAVGYDKDNNKFTSLEGFDFTWKLGESDCYDCLESLKNSQLNSYRLYTRGVKRGMVTVQLKINAPSYMYLNKDISPIEIAVIEPFDVYPMNQNVIVGSTYNFGLKARVWPQQDANKMKKPSPYNRVSINLPSPYHSWEKTACNLEQTTINNSGEFFSGPQEGVCNLEVYDSSITKVMSKQAKAQATVNVVYPTDLDFNFHDATNTPFVDQILANRNVNKQLDFDLASSTEFLLEAHYYIIKAGLFNDQVGGLQLSKNLEFNFHEKDNQYFETVHIDQFYMVIRAQTIPSNTMKVTSTVTLENIKNAVYPRTAKIFKTKDITITKPVKINHPEKYILLPYLGGRFQGLPTEETYIVKASGGSGSTYNWRIKDDSVASVNHNSGEVKSAQIGKTILEVIDAQIPDNKDQIEVIVASVSQLTWLESQIEILEGGEHASVLNLIALDAESRKFTNCVSLHPTYKGEGLLIEGVNSQQTDRIQTYLQNNQAIVGLSQKYTNDRQTNWSFNNFGICSQQLVKGDSAGLKNVVATVPVGNELSHSETIESQAAQISVFKNLQHMSPNYDQAVQDLFSRDQSKQKNRDFKHFYPEENVFSLQWGSSFIWKFVGGSNFIESNQYSQTHSVTTTREDLLKVKYVSTDKNSFQVKVTCKKPFSTGSGKDFTQDNYKITLQQKSEISSQLLAPAEHNIEIQVRCQPQPDEARSQEVNVEADRWPRHEQSRLFWAQESLGNQEDLPLSYKKGDGKRIHYVLANSKHTVRNLVWDQSQQLYLNHAKMATKISSSDKSVAKLSFLSEKSTFQHDVEADLYDKRRVKFTDKIGSVFLTAYSNSFYGSKGLSSENTGVLASVFGWGIEDQSKIVPGDYAQYFKKDGKYKRYGSLKHDLNIEVVNLVDIKPKQKTLFIESSRENFVLEIMHGSGHFRVYQIVDDHKTMILETRDGVREVQFNPTKAAQYQFEVVDLMFEDVRATTEVTIKELSKVRLHANRTHLERNANTEVEIVGYDSDGTEFDLSLFKMKFEIVGKGLDVQTTESNLKFIVTGRASGNYQLRADGSSGISSDTVDFEVFDSVEIYPQDLLLTPDMSYALNISGGPKPHSQKLSHCYNSENSEVAGVNSDKTYAFEITGHRVGDVKITYTIVEGSDCQAALPNVISSKDIRVRVRLPQSVGIPTMKNRRIDAGSFLKAQAVLFYGQEEFNHGIAPISYAWSTETPTFMSIINTTKKDLISLHGTDERDADEVVNRHQYIRNNLQNDNIALFFTPFNSSAISIDPLIVGDASLTLKLAMPFPEEYSGKQNYFEAKVNLSVVDKVRVKISEYSLKDNQNTHMYLLPPNTRTYVEVVNDNNARDIRLQTEKADSQLASIENKLWIRTNSRLGSETVRVLEDDKFASINVVIEPIYSISAWNYQSAFQVERASQITLPIHFQNEQGHRFADHIEGVEIDHLISHNYVVSIRIEGQKLLITGKRPGHTNIKIFLKEKPHIFDVIHVRVTGREDPVPAKPDPKIGQETIEEPKVPVQTGPSSFGSRLLVLIFILALVTFVLRVGLGKTPQQIYADILVIRDGPRKDSKPQENLSEMHQLKLNPMEKRSPVKDKFQNPARDTFTFGQGDGGSYPSLRRTHPLQGEANGSDPMLASSNEMKSRPLAQSVEPDRRPARATGRHATNYY